ncbi:MAG: hypothetical protein U0168_21100 [Nannocystaceae bacterium]
MPSLLVVLVSGLCAIAVHHPFHNAGWAWLKAATTLLVLEGTLVAVQGPAQGRRRSPRGSLPGSRPTPRSSPSSSATSAAASG